MVQIIGSKFTDYLHEGRIQREDIVDIADIINKKHPGRESDDEIIVYSVGGMPVEDIAWGGTVYRNALKEGIGVELLYGISRICIKGTPFLSTFCRAVLAEV